MKKNETGAPAPKPAKMGFDAELEGQAAKSAVEQWQERAEAQALANKAFVASMLAAMESREAKTEVDRLRLLAVPVAGKLEQLKSALLNWRSRNGGNWARETLIGVLSGWNFRDDEFGHSMYSSRDWEDVMIHALSDDVRQAVIALFRSKDGMSRRDICTYALLCVDEFDVQGLPEITPPNLVQTISVDGAGVGGLRKV